MKVAVVSSGGREHAPAQKLARSPKVQMVYVAPGNGGTALDKHLQSLPITDPEVLAAFVEREGIHFTAVGPEVPLAAGIVDLFRARGLHIFGPVKAATQLESSKDFAKTFIHRHGIPTTKYQTFNDATQAHAYVGQKDAPIVVKADDLIVDKSVVVTMTAEEARSAIDMMLVGNRLSDTGARVVIEKFLAGEEAGFIVVCNDENVVALATSQDHKRLLDGDTGPNTGGMGTYSSAPVVTPTLHTRTLREIIMPTIRGMEEDGVPYTGFLYVGLMIDAKGSPRTFEFNCRMSGPETQPIMVRMKTDLYDVLNRAIDDRLDGMELDWDRRTTLGIVMATHNYPDTPRRGNVITDIPKGTEDNVAFHAGTTLKDGVLTTNGDRVLCVVNLADTVRAAQRVAHNAIEQIHFDGAQYRTDIGHRTTRH